MRLVLTIALVAVPVLAVMADTALWFYAEAQLTERYANWTATRRAQGLNVSSGPATRGGWPFAARLGFTDMQIGGLDAQVPTGISWSAPAVVLGVEWLHPTRLSISVQGRQVLRVGPTPPLSIEADQMVLLVPLNDSAMPADGVARNIRVRADGAPETDRLMTAADATWRVTGDPMANRDTPALRVEATAHGIDVPAAASPATAAPATAAPATAAPATEAASPGGAASLGRMVDEVSFDAALSGPLALTGAPSARIMAWRDGGGSIEVQRLALRSGQLSINARASLAVDARLQPIGSGTVRLTGQSEALDQLADSGTISRRSVIAAKAVLGMIARPAVGGAPSEVEIPLTLRDRVLSMGQIPLARLPEFGWTLQ